MNAEDFYLNEDGLLVFTSAYHLKRGFCCKNGCRHCPWKDARPKNKLNKNENKNRKP